MSRSTAVVLDPVAAVLALGLLAGGLLVAMWPGAAGHDLRFGWWPLWLVGMPASACLAWCLCRAVAAQRTTLAVPLRRPPRRWRRSLRRHPAFSRRRLLLAALDLGAR